MSKRYQVRFTIAATGQPIQDQPLCWHDTLEDAEEFCVRAVVAALEDEGLSLESAVYEDGVLHHEHKAPRFYPWSDIEGRQVQ